MLENSFGSMLKFLNYCLAVIHLLFKDESGAEFGFCDNALRQS